MILERGILGGRVVLGQSKPELALSLACILMLASSFSPWQVTEGLSVPGLGSWHGVATFAGGVLLLLSMLTTSGAFRLDVLEARKPLTDAGVGFLGGSLGIIGSSAYPPTIMEGASLGLGIYLAALGGLLGLLSSYGLYRRAAPAIPRGL